MVHREVVGQFLNDVKLHIVISGKEMIFTEFVKDVRTVKEWYFHPQIGSRTLHVMKNWGCKWGWKYQFFTENIQ